MSIKGRLDQIWIQIISKVRIILKKKVFKLIDILQSIEGICPTIHWWALLSNDILGCFLYELLIFVLLLFENFFLDCTLRRGTKLVWLDKGTCTVGSTSFSILFLVWFLSFQGSQPIGVFINRSASIWVIVQLISSLWLLFLEIFLSILSSFLLKRCTTHTNILFILIRTFVIGVLLLGNLVIFVVVDGWAPACNTLVKPN